YILIFSGLAEFREMELFAQWDWRQLTTIVAFRRQRCAGFSETERIKPPNRQCGRDFQRGRTAHARAHRDIARNCCVKTVEVDSTLAELFEHAFDVIRPWCIGIFLQVIRPKELGLVKGA